MVVPLSRAGAPGTMGKHRPEGQRIVKRGEVVSAYPEHGPIMALGPLEFKQRLRRRQFAPRLTTKIRSGIRTAR